MTVRNTSMILAWTLVVLVPSLALAEAPETTKPRVAVTRHAGTFNGECIRYTAAVREIFLNDGAGKPAATATTIAYVREGVKNPTKRPVMFLFNGGPGASSSPLHMNALGPYRRSAGASAANKRGWIENPLSPLDAADLVFIDPVGTGFSRPLPGADSALFYSTSADAEAFKTVIQTWLKDNGRAGSPRYLVGESYGTVRAANIVKISPDLPFDGVLLIALAGDVPGHEMPYVVSLPTMATGAWYHEKIDRAGRTVAQQFDAAVQFARTEYLAALVQGGSLPSTERRRIAERMSALIGLPADFIESKNLRLSKNDWMFNVLKDRGLRTGLLDVTVTGPLEPGQEGAIDDPALGVVPQRPANAPPAPPPTPAAVGPMRSPVLAAYFKEILNYPATEPYFGVNFSVNAAWVHEANGNAYEDLSRALREHPNMRLFWAAGYYDLTTPAYAGRYVLDQAGVPAQQLTAAYFVGPHGVYEGEKNLAEFSSAVRSFVGRR